MIKDLILYYSADLPEIVDLCSSEKRIILKPLEKWIHNGKAQFLNETPTAFILSHAFLKSNSPWIRESPLPDGCVVVYNPETRTIPEDIPDSLIYQELYGFSVPEAVARTLRNLYRQSLLAWEVRQKDKLIKDKDKIFKEVLEVGIALSAERDNDKLLEAILLRLRQMTGADAGSLYLLL